MSNESRESIIRVATLSDLENVLSVFKKSIQKSCSNDYSPDQINAWTQSALDREKWLSRIANDYFIVVEKAGSILGFASLKGSDYVDLLYVHPNHQGKGLALKLLNAMKHYAEQDNVERLYTHSSKTALPFFENQGYNVLERNKKVIDEVELVNFLMALDLKKDDNS